MDRSCIFRYLSRPASLVYTLCALGYGAPTLASAAESLVLETSANWRVYYVWRPVLYGSRTNSWRVAEEGFYANSPTPPINWTSPEFDDDSWHLTRGPVLDGYGFEQPQELAQLCLRAKFELRESDTNRGLILSLSYRGGAVIYVNGHEIARAHLPEGPLLPDTPADDYPYEAYTSIENRPIGHERMSRVALADRLELRIRKLQNVFVPTKLLRAGTNVLAVGLHRTVVHNLPKSYTTDWSTVGFISANLKSYPKGTRVWNASALRAIREQDYGDGFASLDAITLVGPRNGICSGQVVISSRETINRLEAVCSDFRASESSALIPRDRVLVRYPVLPGRLPRLFRSMESDPYYDPLSVDPPRQATIQPVWVTVRIPERTPAGAYTASLTINAGNQTHVVPVSLTVCDWAAPAPSNFAAHVSLIQSPDSVALKYGVPLWSDAHFRLMRKSFELLAELGNKTIVLPLVSQTHLGNEQSMVRWIRQADQSLKPDFSVLDQYLDLCREHVSNPAVICLYVWEPFMGSDRHAGFNYDSMINLEFRSNSIPVTLWDPQKAEATLLDAPSYSTPEGRNFWQPVLEGVRARINSRGWQDRKIMLGLIADRWPTTQVIDFFKEIAPYAAWAMHCHPVGNTNIYDASIQHTASALPVPIDVLDKTPLHERHHAHGWKAPWEKTIFPRGPLSKLKRPYLTSVYADPAAFRNVVESALMAGYRGIARLGLDFWDLPDTISNTGRDPFRRGFNVAARFPISNWGSLSLSACVHHLAAAGPDGAIPTVRFEMLREGLQEAEARIFIEKILTDETLRPRVSSELLQRSEKVLDERLNAWLIGCMSWDWFMGSGWQERTRLLFDTAGELADVVSTLRSSATAEDGQNSALAKAPD